MAVTTADEVKKLNNMNPAAKKVGLGTRINALETPGAAVALAAGVNPTKAEFDALVNSLKTKGVIS